MWLAALLLVRGLVAQTDDVPALPLHAPWTAEERAAVGAAVGERSIVLLGEAIYLTNELPRARLPFVEALHADKGFDVLALEGSAIDAFLAEEVLLRTGDVDEAQRLAWLPIWQTAAMRELMVYVASTRGALTLTSFDLQVGSSRATGMGLGAYVKLFEVLERYARPPAGVVAADMATALQAMSRCQPDRCPWSADDSERVRPHIAAVASWIADAAPKVAAATTPGHGRALALVPALLAARLTLVEVTGKAPEPERKIVFAKTRDKLMAELALGLQERVSASHKVILWAHNRHVNLSPTGAGHPSMGRRLADVDRPSVFAVGTFVGGGRALLLDESAGAALDISERDVEPAASFAVDAKLSAAKLPLAWFDIAGARAHLPAASPWRARGTSRLEGASMELSLVDDYDGALYVDEVSPPDLAFLPPSARWLVRVHGLWSDHGFALAMLCALLSLATLYGIVALASRKR